MSDDTLKQAVTIALKKVKEAQAQAEAAYAALAQAYLDADDFAAAYQIASNGRDVLGAGFLSQIHEKCSARYMGWLASEYKLAGR